LLELLQTEFREGDLEFARALAETLMMQFEDRAEGGFFFVRHDHEKLIHRSKTGHDNATPSGNGVAAFALQRLGHLLGEQRYLAAAERTIQQFYPALESNPGAHVSLASALEEWVEPPQIVLVRGTGSEFESWRRSLAEPYRPATLVIAIPAAVQNLPPTLAKSDGAECSAEAISARVCRGTTCLPEVRELDALKDLLADH